MKKTELAAIQNEEQKSLFIKYLDSSLNKYRKQSSSSSFFSNGDFINESKFKIVIDGVSIDLLIRIVSCEDGDLKYIEYDDEGNGNKIIDDFITTSLMKSLGNVKQKYYKQYYYCYFGEQLDGEYWIKGVRIAPVHYDNESKSLGNVERYFSIEVNVDAIDDLDATAIGNKLADIYAAKLSLLLDIGISPPRVEHRWFISESCSKQSVLRQTGYHGYGHDLNNMPKKKELCKSGDFDRSIHPYTRYLGDTRKLPNETRKLFTALDKTDQNIEDSFNNCCFLYQLALNSGRYSKTVELSYMVAAVDALSTHEIKHLKEFRAFMRHYSQAKEDIEHLLGFMYGDVRSAHFHSGQFPSGEYDHKRLSTLMLTNVEQRNNEHMFRESKKLIRVAIANWVQELLKK